MDWLYFILGFTLGAGITILAIALLAMFASVSKLEQDIKYKPPIKRGL